MEFTTPPPMVPAGENDRLESWKAIASYLSRDVRTVQRWESREGLPVHRHQHNKLASVYAFRSELRRWQEARTPPGNEAEAAEPPGSASPTLSLDTGPSAVAPVLRANRALSRSTTFWLLSLVGLFAIAVGVYLAAIARDTTPPASSRIASLVMFPADLVAPAPLSAAAPEVGDALRKAWVGAGGHVLSDSVRRSTLTLMRRSSEEQLTAELARELAMRAKGVHVVIEPRLQETTAGYHLTLLAWAGPEAREGIATVSSVPVSRSTLASEAARLTGQIIHTFPSRAPLPTAGLPRVTVRSLEALIGFAQADRMMKRSLWEPAIPLLRKSISVEPEFAAAYVHLAWVISNLRKPAAEWRPLLETGMQLREAAGEPERWFVVGTYHQLLGQDEQAVAAYERVLTSEPGHYWALGNLANIRNRQGQHEEAGRFWVRRARAHPDSLVSQIVAADQSQLAGEEEAARAFRHQAADLLHDVSSEERWISERWLPFFDACEAWKRRDAPAVGGIAEKLRERLASDRRTSPGDYYRLGFLYLDIGMTRRAEAAFAGAAERSHHQYLAVAAAARHDWQLAAKALSDHSKHFERTVPATGNLFVEAGLIADADRLMARWDRERFWPEHIVAPFRAALHVAHGRPAEASRVLDASLPRLRQPEPEWTDGLAGGGAFLNALRVKARLLRDEGRAREAIAMLQEADAQPVCTAYRSNGSPWMALRAELAAMYRQQGMADRAEAVEADLAERLALADRDYAVLAVIKGAARP